MKARKRVLEKELKEPAFREHWEKTALARAVALRLVSYRVDHKLSQMQLAKRLGMKQPAVARLEAGETTPAWATLGRLSDKLGIEFVVGITPLRRKSMVGRQIDQAEIVERVTTPHGRVFVAVS